LPFGNGPLLDRAKVLCQSVGFDDEVLKTTLSVFLKCDGSGKAQNGTKYGKRLQRRVFPYLAPGMSQIYFAALHRPPFSLVEIGRRTSGPVSCVRDDENRGTEMKNGWRRSCKSWTNFGGFYHRLPVSASTIAPHAPRPTPHEHASRAPNITRHPPTPNNRKKRMLHRRPFFQRLRKPRKLRRRPPASRRMPHIIANKAN
jgi:hypothetical protein